MLLFVNLFPHFINVSLNLIAVFWSVRWPTQFDQNPLLFLIQTTNKKMLIKNGQPRTDSCVNPVNSSFQFEKRASCAFNGTIDVYFLLILLFCLAHN